MSAPGKTPFPVRHVANLLVVALLSAYVIAFGWFWNEQHDVMIQYWPGIAPERMSVVYPMLFACLTGFLVAGLLGGIIGVEQALELRRVRRHLRQLQEENARLRNVPEDGGSERRTRGIPG
jgi:uncharacterized membrane protein YciS (DUF1049 family)